MTAALEYACRKSPPDKDNPARRKYIADEILAAALNGQPSHGDLVDVGLRLEIAAFPPGRLWLKALRG